MRALYIRYKSIEAIRAIVLYYYNNKYAIHALYELPGHGWARLRTVPSTSGALKWMMLCPC
jgi:hypothetical protein